MFRTADLRVCLIPKYLEVALYAYAETPKCLKVPFHAKLDPSKVLRTAFLCEY